MVDGHPSQTPLSLSCYAHGQRLTAAASSIKSSTGSTGWAHSIALSSLDGTCKIGFMPVGDLLFGIGAASCLTFSVACSRTSRAWVVPRRRFDEVDGRDGYVMGLSGWPRQLSPKILATIGATPAKPFYVTAPSEPKRASLNLISSVLLTPRWPPVIPRWASFRYLCFMEAGTISCRALGRLSLLSRCRYSTPLMSWFHVTS